jgi:hypothetical protein
MNSPTNSASSRYDSGFSRPEVAKSTKARDHRSTTATSTDCMGVAA